jgi:hypothetical protein
MPSSRFPSNHAWICATLAIAVNFGFGGQVTAGLSIDEIMSMLPRQPCSLGRTIEDRRAWDPLAATDAGRRAIQEATDLVDKRIPEFASALYMEYFENGNRARYQAYEGRRWAHLRTLVLGELLENRGRFINDIEQAIASLCRGPSWVLPAHDREAVIINGKAQYVDLSASMRAHDMAIVYSLLGKRLSESTRAVTQENLRRRVVEPTFHAIREPDERSIQRYHFWRRATHNWNAVCTAGTTGVILATVESQRDRAEAVAEALKNIESYLAGFTDDGYCSEGLGYWSYGFRHFLVLRQLLMEQTEGQIDLLDRPKARAAAKFPLRIHILDGVYPAFADCAADGQPHGPSMTYLGWRAAPSPQTALTSNDALYWTMIALFNPVTGAQADKPAKEAVSTWFNHGGVLIARPGEDTGRRFAVALKAGHNAEHHNHNDVGSYVVVLDGQALLMDPGSMVYTADTFSSKRYRFAMMNSYGHPVPTINGKLQRPGSEARAKILTLDRTKATDTLGIDLTACYNEPDLISLHRTWIYNRRGDGALTVSDHVKFKKPGEFETALVGADDWRKGKEGELYVRGRNGAALRIEIACEEPYDLRAERIENPGRFEPIRVGLRLREPLREAHVAFLIIPALAPHAEAAQPVAISSELLTVGERH